MDFIDLLSIFLPVLAFICVLIVLSINVYMRIRPKCSINVNCWFCNQWTQVPFDFQNSWDCPYCEQYNGFTKDGDYNKQIPAQHDELMNKQVPFSQSSTSTTPDNGLCKVCNNNQQLKIQQLAMFSPIDENKFDEEVERYEKQLERAYRLCQQCELTVKRTLHKQKSILLGLRLSALRKQGLDYLNLDKSLPGLSKTAKRKFFLTAIQYTTIALAIVRLSDIVKSYDFSNKSLTRALPGTFVPYALLVKDLSLSMYNLILSLFEYLQYFQFTIFENYYSSVNDILQTYISYFNLMYLDFAFLSSYVPSFINFNRTFLLSSVGVFLQSVFVIFSSRVRYVEYVKCIVWFLMMYIGSENFNKSNPRLVVSAKILEIILCLFVVAAKSSKTQDKKPKKKPFETAENISATQETEFSDEELDCDKHVDLLNSTFKSQNSDKLNSSLNSTVSVNPFNSSASSVKLFTAKPNDFDKSHIFGEKPVFENLLNTSYFKYSPKYRSPCSSNESFSTRKSCINESLNSSWYSNNHNESFGFPTNESPEIRVPELELNKGLSDLHLSSCPSIKKSSNSNLPPAFRVSSPTLARPKPVLSPPRLRNVAQSSWVAGGYWKSSNDCLNNSGSFSNLSRSSSQSSGFGSQTSSQQHNNFENNVYNSLPSSRNNSVCGEYDKYSVFSEPAYQYNTAHNFYPQSRVIPVLRSDQQIYICPKPTSISSQSRVSKNPPQMHSVLNDNFWNTANSGFALPVTNCNRPCSPESNLSQTILNSSCSTYNPNTSFNSQSFHPTNPFHSPSTLFSVNNTRPMSVCSNISSISQKHSHVQGNLLKKWRDQTSPAKQQ